MVCLGSDLLVVSDVNTTLVNKLNATHIIEFEKKWAKWYYEEKIVWLHYKTQHIDSDISWDEIKNKLKVSNISGKPLQIFDDG